MFKKVLVVSDDPETFTTATGEPISVDAMAEWEDQKTLDSMVTSWSRTGLDVEMLTLNEHFLARFCATAHADTLVHSLAEGWGTLSREAWIPSLCELKGVAWLGSSPFGLTACMDKDLVAAICRTLQVPSPQGIFVTNESDYQNFDLSKLGHHHFIKPNGEGSGMGIGPESLRSIDNPLSPKQLKNLLRDYPNGVRVEEALPGVEFTTALVGSDPEFLPIAQIRVPDGIYGIAHKRKDEMTEEVLFPTLSNSQTSQLEEWSRKLWNRFELKDFCRFDWKCNRQGEPHLIDINPLAGLSPHYSVLPLMWKKKGRSHSSLLATLARSAWEKVGSRSLCYGSLRLQATRSPNL